MAVITQMNHITKTGEHQRRGVHLLIKVLKRIVSNFYLQGKNQTNLLKWHIVLVLNTFLLLL